MIGLGYLDPNNPNPFSAAYGVSGDGTVVVGQSRDASGTSGLPEAFRWTSATGMTGLGFLDPNNAGRQSAALGVSGDGTSIVGWSTSAAANGGPEAIRWTSATGMTGLGGLSGGTGSYANAISSDGTTVVGTSTVFGGVSDEAYRWNDGVMTGHGFLDAKKPSPPQRSFWGLRRRLDRGWDKLAGWSV